jgi:predicted dehydrogenase
MIGAGSMARHHLEAWSRSVDAEVIAIYNRTQHKAEALAREFAIPYVCVDVYDLIHGNDVDAVSISMPHSLHHPLAIAAIEAGKHVFCEKPLATLLDDAREMWERAEQAGLKTGIQFGHRTLPALIQLRELLHEGYAGQVQYVECSWCFDWARDPAFPLVWRFRRDVAGAGALADLGVYAIDAARWLIGEFREVSACMRTYIDRRPLPMGNHSFDEIVHMARDGRYAVSGELGAVENEDECVFLATFENGAHGFFRASRLQGEQRLAVHGSEGVLVWTLGGDKLLGRRSGQGEYDEFPVPKAVAQATIVSQFLANIVDDTDLPPTFCDGVRAQAVIEAVIRSAERRCWVQVPTRSQP